MSMAIAYRLGKKKHDKGVHKPVGEERYGRGASEAGEDYRDYKSEPKGAFSREGAESSKDKHKDILAELMGMRGGRENLACGGEVGEDDMISKIMAKHYSEGGRLANKTEITADFEPNEFDELDLDDDLEQHDTGANSGDELGDHQEDEDRHDIVSKIMRSRAKRDKLPRPA